MIFIFLLILQTFIFSSFQQPTVWSVPASCDVADACRAPAEAASTESLLDTFTADERAALAALPAANNTDDLLLLAQLHKKGTALLSFIIDPCQGIQISLNPIVKAPKCCF